MPTEKELKQVANYESTPEILGLTERLFISLKKVPCFSERVTALNIKHTAESNFESLRKRSRCLIDAHTEVTDSLAFRKLLEVVLAIGNYMNGTGFRGGAYGFSVGLLVKLKDTKGEGGVSMLEFVVNFLKNNSPDTLSLGDDWPNLKEAVRRKV